MADRVKVAEGSFFDAMTEAGDAYLLKHIIHDWADDEATQILGNIRKAAGVGKHVLIVEFVILRTAANFQATGWIWKCTSQLAPVSARPPNTTGY